MSGRSADWPIVKLSDISTSIRNGLFASRPTNGPDGTPILRISSVKNGRLDTEDVKYVQDLTTDQVDAFKLEPGDLLFTRYNGTRSYVGRCAIVPDLHRVLVHPDKLIRVKLDQMEADPKFVAYQMESPQVREFLGPRIRTTAGQSGISGKDIRVVPVALPGIAEQRRIVEILEEHLSHLDAAEAQLSIAARRLNAFEGSVLAHAVTGKAMGLGDVTDIQGGIQKQPKRAPRENSYPFLRVANVTARGLDLAEIHRIELFDGELDRLRLARGDLLVVEGNGSPSQIGRAALWDGSIPDCVHQNHLIRVRARRGLLPAYLEIVWNSPENRARLTDLASSSSGLHTLSVSKLKLLDIRVPALDSQAAIVGRVAEARSRRRLLKADVQRATNHGAALRRAILAAAFSGRLTLSKRNRDVIEELVNA